MTDDIKKPRIDKLRESIKWNGAKSQLSELSRTQNIPSAPPDDGHLSLVFDGPRTWLGFAAAFFDDAHCMYFAVEVLHQYAAAGHEGIRSGMLGVIPLHCATVLNVLRFPSGIPTYVRLADFGSVEYADAFAAQYKNIVAPSSIITNVKPPGIDLSKLTGG